MASRVAPQAEADLDEIWLHAARESGSLDVANRLIDAITDRFCLLAGFPMRDALATGILAPVCAAFLWANT